MPSLHSCPRRTPPSWHRLLPVRLPPVRCVAYACVCQCNFYNSPIQPYALLVHLLDYDGHLYTVFVFIMICLVVGKAFLYE